jgi:hypothetical protein
MKLLGFKTIPIAFLLLAVHFHKNLAPKILLAALTMSWIGDIIYCLRIKENCISLQD